MKVRLAPARSTYIAISNIYVVENEGECIINKRARAIQQQLPFAFWKEGAQGLRAKGAYIGGEILGAGILVCTGTSLCKRRGLGLRLRVGCLHLLPVASSLSVSFLIAKRDQNNQIAGGIQTNRVQVCTSAGTLRGGR